MPDDVQSVGLSHDELLKCLNYFPSHRKTDHAPALTEQVHVIILDTLVGGVTLMDEGGPDPSHFVGRETGTHSAATNGDTALHFALGDRPSQWVTKSG